MSELAQNLVSLARTQRRIAGQYAAWAREGGKNMARDMKEAARLRREARWHLSWARDELRNVRALEAAE